MFNKPKNVSKMVARVNLTSILKAKVLLSEDKRYELISGIKENLGLSKSQFDSLCLPLMDELAESCQQLPSSRHRYYTRLGGLLDFALFRAYAASLLFRQSVLPPETHKLSNEQSRIAYALFSAALLRGIGALCTDYSVDFYTDKGTFVSIWQPIWEKMTDKAEFYQFKFNEKSVDELSVHFTPLLARKWMPQDGFQWIAEDPELLLSWFEWLKEETEGSHVLQAILERSEALAIQEMMKEALKAYVDIYPEQRFPSFVETSIPQQPLELIGLKFLMWLRENLARGQMVLNQAHLTAVENGLLIGEETFKWFVQQHGEFKNWRIVQKGLMSLGFHQQNSGYEHGLLLQQPERFFSKEIIVRQAGHMHHIRVQSMALLVGNNWKKLVQGKTLETDMLQKRLNAKGQFETVSGLDNTFGMNKNV